MRSIFIFMTGANFDDFMIARRIIPGGDDEQLALESPECVVAHTAMDQEFARKTMLFYCRGRENGHLSFFFINLSILYSSYRLCLRAMVNIEGPLS